MAPKTEFSVVVPCYNEAKNIPLIVSRFAQVLPTEIQVELVLVNNGSLDNSAEIIGKLAKENHFLKIVTVNENIGYGHGIWTGLQASKGEFLCWTHADLQTDLKDTFAAYNLIIKQKNPKNCFVKGKRRGRPLFDQFFTFGMSVFETLMLKKMLYDINAQPNLFHRSFLDKINNPPQDFSFDLYFHYVALQLRYHIIRFPVIFRPRIHGHSNWNTSLKGKWKFIKRTIAFTFNLKRRLK